MSSSTPNCNCGIQAVLRTTRQGANAGRSFYCCPKQQSDETRCKFFKWSLKPAATGVEAPRCTKHGVKCVRNIVKKESANKGRAFYTCPAQDRCTYIWEDELVAAQMNGLAGRTNTSEPLAKIELQIVGSKDDENPQHELVQCNQFYLLVSLPPDLPFAHEVYNVLENIKEGYCPPNST